jgi:hypothetical protein
VKVRVAALTKVEIAVDIVLIIVDVSTTRALVRDGEFMPEGKLGEAESLLGDIVAEAGVDIVGIDGGVENDAVGTASTIPVPRMLMELDEVVVLEDAMLEDEAVVDELVAAASTKLLVELVIG